MWFVISVGFWDLNNIFSLDPVGSYKEVHILNIVLRLHLCCMYFSACLFYNKKFKIYSEHSRIFIDQEKSISFNLTARNNEIEAMRY